MTKPLAELLTLRMIRWPSSKRWHIENETYPGYSYCGRPHAPNWRRDHQAADYATPSEVGAFDTCLACLYAMEASST